MRIPPGSRTSRPALRLRPPEPVWVVRRHGTDRTDIGMTVEVSGNRNANVSCNRLFDEFLGNSGRWEFSPDTVAGPTDSPKALGRTIRNWTVRPGSPSRSGDVRCRDHRRARPALPPAGPPAAQGSASKPRRDHCPDTDGRSGRDRRYPAFLPGGRLRTCRGTADRNRPGLHGRKTLKAGRATSCLFRAMRRNRIRTETLLAGTG